MLCDEIIAEKAVPRLFPGFELMQPIVKGAHKYVLSPDFTAAADGLANNFQALDRIMPFCRLPFPICWFELAQGDRRSFVAAGMGNDEAITKLQAEVKRVGFLMVAHGDNMWEWVTALMWSSYNKTGTSGAPIDNFIACNASFAMITFNSKTEKPYVGADQSFSDCVRVAPAMHCPPQVEREMQKLGSPMFKMIQADWGGEIRFMIAMLGLLNARNVAEEQLVDKTEHNRKRAKHKDSPLCSHTMLKIRASHRRSLMGVRGKGMPSEIRSHFVSGHWKARRTGLFWWNPFMRGSAEHGLVTHDYEVRV